MWHLARIDLWQGAQGKGVLECRAQSRSSPHQNHSHTPGRDGRRQEAIERVGRVGRLINRLSTEPQRERSRPYPTAAALRTTLCRRPPKKATSMPDPTTPRMAPPASTSTSRTSRASASQRAGANQRGAVPTLQQSAGRRL